MKSEYIKQENSEIFAE